MFSSRSELYRFRWVALQLEELITCSSRRDVKNQLQAMPKDLGGIYEKILSRSHKPDDLKRFLQLLAFAVRPMKIEEVAEVVVVNFVSNEGPSYDADLRYVDPKDVLTVCSGLITEFEGSVMYEHQHGCFLTLFRDREAGAHVCQGIFDF